MPRVQGGEDIPAALAAILEAVTKGEITPGEGQAMAAMLEAYRKGVELTDIEARVSALEGRVK